MENILSICESVTNLIESVRIPATILPSQLVYMGNMGKPGISPMMVASKIISRQSEAGAPYGPNTDGSANVAEAMEAIRVEEIVNAIRDDGQIQISIPPGAIQFTGSGANVGGPVSVVGTNINFVSGVGMLL